MSQKICPKCKKPVNDNAIRCPHCNMRLKVICPTCNMANLFGLDSCTNCGTILIKYCENCGSANFPDAKECRKCHTSFEETVLTFEKNRSKTFSKSNEKIEPQKSTLSQQTQPVQPVQPQAASQSELPQEEYVEDAIIPENLAYQPQ